MKFTIPALVASFVLSACGKIEEPVHSQHQRAESVNTMSQQIAAIKSCMEQGLTEETCAGVHKQMVTGTLTGSASMAACEAQYGVGQCGNVPVTRSNGSSESIIMPLIAGAALGYLAHSMFLSDSMPVGATAPTRAWVENRPAIYQQAIVRERVRTGFVPQKPTTNSQAQSFAQKDAYSQKSTTINGNPVASSNNVPTPQQTPGAVKPEPVKPAPTAATQSQKSTVQYKAPTSGYAQQVRPSTPSPAPSPSRSNSSGRGR